MRSLKFSVLDALDDLRQVPKIDGASYRLILSGLIDRRTPWTLQELYQLRCTRKPSSPSRFPTRSWRPATVIRSSCAFQLNLGSRIQNGSRRFS
jgi:hypothetical protein